MRPSRIAFLLLPFLAGADLRANVATYAFSTSSSTYAPISGTVVASAAWDDTQSALITLPFTFTYNNTPFTTVGIHSNGFITLGALATNTYCGLQGSPPNSIAGYGTDLVSASAGSSVQYTTLGSAPSRRFVVQWADCDHYNNGQQDHITFQVVLNEADNSVQVIFGPTTMASTFGANTCADTPNESGSVGLLGSSTNNFNMRRVTTQASTWATSTAATAISDVCNLSPTLLPAAGLTWTWTPPVPTPMTFVSATTVFLNNGQVDARGSQLNAILQVRVVTSGNLTPFSVSALALSTSGCTNASADISSARVYFTGGGSVFTSANPFGSTINAPSGGYSATGSVTLEEGTNYFWVVYDIKPTAVLNDVLSGCCTQITGSGTMGARVPSVTCPAGSQTVGQQLGTWTPLASNAPHSSGGLALLLSDGSVMLKTDAGGGDGIGNTWDRLVPSNTGSYVNGTWSTLAGMSSTRLYFSSQLLKDGRVYVAGGEYGTGGAAAEVYDPLTNAWTACPAPGNTVSDANSVILDDGRVLQALVSGSLRSTVIYDPATNSYSSGPTCLGIHNESSWVKLPDNSVLFVDRLSTASERYMPATNTWIADATVPVALYDPFGDETGPGLLLADGRAFFIGSSGHTAFYTPSGSTAPGTWTAGPDVPNGLGAPDAAAALMVNGRVLCAVSPAPTSDDHFPPPIYLYEFDPTTNLFQLAAAPTGGTSINGSCYITTMLDLPDGTVLFSLQGYAQLYVYTPSGTPVSSAKPAITAVAQNACGVYTITGTQFNGVSEGAYYGDDWQMSTNYPLVRLTSGANVYYARTMNWNSTGVRRGAQVDNVQFTLPPGLPASTYALVVVANGIASDPVSFTPSATIAPGVSIAITAGANPTTPGASITFTATPTTAGTTPAYQWKVNGGNVGTNSSTYSTTTLTNGQVVTCVITSSLACAAPLTATSNAITITTIGARVSPRVLLEGPYVQASAMMYDSLRVKGLIPLSEPFTALGYVHSGGGGGETIAASVLTGTGSDAIVDWVIVELRSNADPSQIVASRSALVQRDGDVVGTDGSSPVVFSQAAGNYYVAVRHRNHLGAMTATTRALSNTTTTVDLTTAATATYGSGARKAVGSVQVLLAGNALYDHQLAYTGGGNDRDPILVAIGGTTPNNVLHAYRSEDVNMDGTVKYTGLNNDRDPILVNIGGTLPTNVLLEQLP